jgi:hypothetical protein
MIALRMAGILNEVVCSHMQHLYCRLQDIWQESAVSVRVCMSRLLFIIELYIYCRAVFQFPVRSLAVWLSTVDGWRCRGVDIYCFDCIGSLMGNVTIYIQYSDSRSDSSGRFRYPHFRITKSFFQPLPLPAQCYHVFILKLRA